jgi:ribosomal protein L32E
MNKMKETRGLTPLEIQNVYVMGVKDLNNLKVKVEDKKTIKSIEEE